VSTSADEAPCEGWREASSRHAPTLSTGLPSRRPRSGVSNEGTCAGLRVPFRPTRALAYETSMNGLGNRVGELLTLAALAELTNRTVHAVLAQVNSELT
jgi:hypothetical protein